MRWFQHVDRDSLLTEWEDGVLMKDGSSHVGKLTQLTVGNGGNDFRILDDTRIGYQETGNIGPVLVDVRCTAFATMEPVISDPPREKVFTLPSGFAP